MGLAVDHFEIVSPLSRAWRSIRKIPPNAIIAIGWLLFMFYGYPGLLSMDSFDQLAEARARLFTDSHPPAMAVLWSLVDRIVAGPFGMLVIQGTTFLVGAYVLLRRAMRPRTAALWACVVLLFPPVLAPMVVIWKDSMMAGFLLLGLALIHDERRWAKIGGVVSLLIASTMRYNALAATLPIVVLLFEWQPNSRWPVRYSSAFVVWLGITIVALAINVRLTDRRMHFWSSSFALADIVGTLDKVDIDLPDSTLRPLLSPTGIRVDHEIHAAIRAKYQAAEFSQLISGDSPLWLVPIRGTTPSPRTQREAIEHAWIALVSEYPGAYMRYRAETFGECLGLSTKFKGLMVMERRGQTPELLQQFGIQRGALHYQYLAERGVRFVATKTLLFRPYLYALVAIVLLALFRVDRDILAILVSGLVMEMSLLPSAVTPDFRYSHWLVICTCVALVMSIARRTRRRSAGIVEETCRVSAADAGL